MIQKLIYTITILMFLSNISIAQKQIINILNGKYTSTKNTHRLKTFVASKGDVIEFKLTTLHKRRGLNIWIKQQPGDLVVLDYEKLRNSTKKITAPADAIYQVYYGGTKLDFNIDIINHTNKPQGPQRGEAMYVRIPDTIHSSAYVNKCIGENYTISPYTEKVKLSTVIQSEQISSRDFITGTDLLNISIPADVKDDYREQKLLSYSFSLTCSTPSSYKAMMGIVDAGMDAYIPDLSMDLLKKKSKVKKMNHTNRYNVVDINKENQKLEKTIATLKLTQELGDSLAPGNETDADKILATTAFLLDTDGMKKMALEKSLKTIGAPDELFAVMNAVERIPSPIDMLSKGMHEYVNKTKGSAVVNVYEKRKCTEEVYLSPASISEYWIQSAMNYGKNMGACWDVPGNLKTGENGLNIKCWDIDKGKDRLFKFVASTKFPGYYEIHSALSSYTIDNSGGNNNLKKKSNNILLWSRHGGESQVFKLKHIGGGKYKIYNHKGFIICLDGRKNSNGTNIHIWEDHEGAFTEWYFVNPITSKAFIPSKQKLPNGNVKTIDVWKDVCVAGEKGSAINKKILVANEDDPLNLDLAFKDVKFLILKNSDVSQTKLLIEAKYKITDYTDVIKYKRTTTKVNTRDFLTSYKINYNYAIMFKDQMKAYYENIGKSEYYNNRRPKSEIINSEDHEQKQRLAKFKLIKNN